MILELAEEDRRVVNTLGWSLGDRALFVVVALSSVLVAVTSLPELSNNGLTLGSVRRTFALTNGDQIGLGGVSKILSLEVTGGNTSLGVGDGSNGVILLLSRAAVRSGC
jgi:hypothetical protein